MRLIPRFKQNASYLALGVACGLLVVPEGLRAQTQAPHVHGVAELDVAIDERHLTVMLTSPLDNLLGFEHAPRTDEERALAADVLQQLERFDNLVLPDPAGECSLQTVTLDADALTGLPAHSHSHAGHHRDHGAHAESHADLELTAVFECKQGPAVAYLDSSLFDAFGGLQHLNVQVASPAHQTGITVQRDTKRIQWQR